MKFERWRREAALETAQREVRQGGRYVEVPSYRLFAMLEGADFVKGAVGHEIVYSRQHARDERLSVVIYTSVAYGEGSARGCGEDAIRVVALFTWLHRQSNEVRRKKLFSAKVLRVNSVEGVLERTLQAMRAAYAACNDWLKQNK